MNIAIYLSRLVDGEAEEINSIEIIQNSYLSQHRLDDSSSISPSINAVSVKIFVCIGAGLRIC